MRRDDGFTLTEVLVALFLLTAVSVVFLPVMNSSLLATRELDSAARSNDAGRLALAQLDREFRAAEQICEPAAGDSANRLRFITRAYTTTTTATGTQELIYELRDPDGDGAATHLQRSHDDGSTWRTVIENVENEAKGVSVFTVEGGTGAPNFPSEGKVVTVELWVDANPNDRSVAKLFTTELSGRNIWNPNAPAC